MCADSCSNPPLMSCAFYKQCAENMLGCGPSGYPLGYGDKNCNKFVNNLNFFDSAGQDFIWGTMHCLQTAMVPVLQPCTATCASFTAAAFASHPGCYVANGFCSLSCGDMLVLLATVGMDLFSGDVFSQVIGTAQGCAANIVQTLGGCAGTVLTEGPIDAIPVAVTQIIFNVIINAL